MPENPFIIKAQQQRKECARATMMNHYRELRKLAERLDGESRKRVEARAEEARQILEEMGA